MNLDDCTPGKAIYHKFGFYAIIIGHTMISGITGRLMIQVMKTTGDNFWAYPESMTEHLPKKR